MMYTLELAKSLFESRLIFVSLQGRFRRYGLVSVKDGKYPIDLVLPFQGLFFSRPAQCVEGLNVHGIIGAIAGIGFIVNGNRPIGADRKVVDDLLEIRAVVFGSDLG